MGCAAPKVHQSVVDIERMGGALSKWTRGSYALPSGFSFRGHPVVSRPHPIGEQRAIALEAQSSMQNLLSRIATSRDEAAFRELFEAYGSRLRSFMMRSGADAGTADELAQEALLMVWRKAGLYQPEKGSVNGWIFTIARNLRIDRLRKEFNWLELSDEMLQALPSDDIAQDDALASRERQERVRVVLKDLGPEQRQIIELAYIEGFSHSQIAERLGLPLGTVKSRMRLAYQKVRVALEDLR
jgi:RNA polymerase sigma-70 factor, ECF subfamily